VKDVRSLLRFDGDLSAIDTRATPGVKSRKKAEAMFQADTAELGEMQERLYAEGTRAVVLLLQGTDTCGKDGTVTHVVGQVNPAGLRITTYKKPTPAELKHHFHWRIRGKTRADHRMGVPQGPCGVLHVKARQIEANRVLFGTWTVQFDFNRHYDKNAAPRASVKISVFRTFT
jgi:hypothetical protein